MSLDSLFTMFGGLGLFIYGMRIMGEGLEGAAGDRLKSLLELLTRNRFLGVIVGALVTAIIQSSSATTVMVVGLVNAGIMDLSQAIGVI
ncbi:MAG: Na/Pi symporter, partial [Tepidanaerobacteraceae bacterium]